jgi:hypothetical protein
MNSWKIKKEMEDNINVYLLEIDYEVQGVLDWLRTMFN